MHRVCGSGALRCRESSCVESQRRQSSVLLSPGRGMHHRHSNHRAPARSGIIVECKAVVWRVETEARQSKQVGVDVMLPKVEGGAGGAAGPDPRRETDSGNRTHLNSKGTRSKRKERSEPWAGEKRACRENVHHNRPKDTQRRSLHSSELEAHARDLNPDVNEQPRVRLVRDWRCRGNRRIRKVVERGEVGEVERREGEGWRKKSVWCGKRKRRRTSGREPAHGVRTGVRSRSHQPGQVA